MDEKYKYNNYDVAIKMVMKDWREMEYVDPDMDDYHNFVLEMLRENPLKSRKVKSVSRLGDDMVVCDDGKKRNVR